MTLQSRYPNVDIPENISWPGYLFEEFEKFGSNEAIVDGESGRCFTYHDICTKAKSLGSGLTKIGFGKGDVLALYMNNTPEYPIVLLGVTAIGGIVTVVNTMYNEEELCRQLQDCKAKVLIASSSLSANAKAAKTAAQDIKIYTLGETDGCQSVEDLLNDDGSSFPDDVKINPAEDIAVLPYSSGTTGLPKGVMLTHYNLVSQICLSTKDFNQWDKNSTIISVLPFYHIFGLAIIIGVGMSRGSKLVTIPRFQPEKFLQLIQDYKVTHAPVVPPLVLFLAKHPLVDKFDLTSLVEVTSGAAPLGKELEDSLRKRFPNAIMKQGYGMTELTGASHICPATGSEKQGSTGFLLPNQESKIIDTDCGAVLGVGKDGEVWVKGPLVMKGYLNNHEATAATIDNDGWLHTGDIGHYDDDGELYIVDRLKELIKYKGHQVAPAELEALLIAHPNIEDAAVIGIPDLEAGELPKAFVVVQGDITADDIVAYVEKNVAPFKKLRGGVEFIDKIPKSPSGKILRRELRKIKQKEEPQGTILKSKYPDVEIPDVSWPDFMFKKFEEYGSKEAIVDGLSGMCYTYNDIQNKAKRLGSRLTKDGFQKGDVLALYMTNAPEYPIILLGITAIGGIVTVVNTMYNAEELRRQLQDSKASYIITNSTLSSNAKVAAGPDIRKIYSTENDEAYESLDVLLNDDGSGFPENVEVNPKEDIAVLPYSSGTTGLPKGVMLTHYNLVSQICLSTKDFNQWDNDSKILTILPFYHIFGLAIVIGVGLSRGSKLISLPKFDPEQFLRLIQDYKVTHAPIVPPLVLFLAKHPMVDQFDLSSLVEVTSGAAPLGKEMEEAVRERLPNIIMKQGYGMTELTGASHICPATGSEKQGSVGPMLPNQESKVIDIETGEVLSNGKNGEILVRGPLVMKGYLNNPEATSDTIDVEGWLHTGDIGHYDDDGDLYIVDRLKELIKYKGHQVAPAELEALLTAHPNIADAAVIGVSSGEVGDLPKAFIVVKGEISENEIIDYVDKNVAPFKKLRGGVEFIDEIPTSSSGKKLRRELKIKELVKQQMQQEYDAQNDNITERQQESDQQNNNETDRQQVSNLQKDNVTERRENSGFQQQEENGKQVQVARNSACCTVS